jgi:hypothetical protein
MIMNNLDKPWQIMPAKLIKLGVSHADKDTDFDHQLAFLLLDVGVETVLKTYLVQKKQNVDNITFPDLLSKVKNEGQKSRIEVDVESLDYYHKVRNKLYHQGDGVKPTNENLKRYSELAGVVLSSLLGVDISEVKLESDYFIWDEFGPIEIIRASSDLLKQMDYFHSSCGLVTELIKPKYSTRKFALEFQKIYDEMCHEFPPESPEEAQMLSSYIKEKFRRFNKLLHTQMDDNNLINYLLEDINHLYVFVTMSQDTDFPEERWYRYEKACSWLKNLVYPFIRTIKDPSQLSAEYKETVSWINTNQEIVDRKIEELAPGTFRPGSGVYDFRISAASLPEE